MLLICSSCVNDQKQADPNEENMGTLADMPSDQLADMPSDQGVVSAPGACSGGKVRAVRVLGNDAWYEIAIPGGEITAIPLPESLKGVFPGATCQDQVATVERGDAGENIRIVSLDGTQDRTFLVSRDINRYLHFSADGSELYFLEEDGGQITGVSKLDLNGALDQQPIQISQIEPEAKFQVNGLTWNPSATKVLGYAYNNEFTDSVGRDHVAQNLAIVDVSSGTIDRVTVDFDGYTLAQSINNPSCTYRNGTIDDYPCGIITGDLNPQQNGWLSDSTLAFRSNRDLWEETLADRSKEIRGDIKILFYDLEGSRTFQELEEATLVDRIPSLVSADGGYQIVAVGAELLLRVYELGNPDPVIEYDDVPQLRDASGAGAYIVYE
jgi:hypothetical protein